MKEREAFNFYRSYFDVLDMMNKKEQLDFLIALLEKQFYGIEPSLKGQSKFAYISQKHSIDKQVEGWENKTKCKLSRPTEDPYQPPTEPPTEDPKQPPTEDPYLQEKGKGKEEEKGKEELKEELIDKKNIYKNNKATIEYIRDLRNCSIDEAITIFSYE
jgi:hypothetical protein